MVKVIPDLFAVLILMGNFIVLWIALHFLLFNPIRGILKQRAEKFAKLGSDIAASEEGTKSRAEQLEAERVEARRQGAQVKEEIKSQGHATEREVIEAATKEMEEVVSKVRTEIKSDIGAAREELKGQVNVFGVDLAQKILGRSIQ